MVGGLNGAATDAAGTVTQVIDQAFTTTAALGPGGARDILFLDLGPIFLDVNAVPGAGNLLCAITGLLDIPGGATNAVANPLDRVSSLLGKREVSQAARAGPRPRTKTVTLVGARGSQ